MLWSDFEEFGKRLNPWREFERDLGSLSRAISRMRTPPTCDFPAVNVWTSSDQAVVTTEIPGVDPETVDISVAEKTLTIRGTRQPGEIGEGESFHRRERWSGQFTKTVDLPFNIETAGVTARFVKGVLFVTLPRAEAEKPRKIEITLN